MKQSQQMDGITAYSTIAVHQIECRARALSKIEQKKDRCVCFMEVGVNAIAIFRNLFLPRLNPSSNEQNAEE